MDRCDWLKIGVERNTGELRHLSLALFQYLVIFLGAELTGISATEYAILVIVWHIPPFHIWSGYLNRGSPWMDEKLREHELTVDHALGWSASPAKIGASRPALCQPGTRAIAARTISI